MKNLLWNSFLKTKTEFSIGSLGNVEDARFYRWWFLQVKLYISQSYTSYLTRCYSVILILMNNSRPIYLSILYSVQNFRLWWTNGMIGLTTTSEYFMFNFLKIAIYNSLDEECVCTWWNFRVKRTLEYRLKVLADKEWDQVKGKRPNPSLHDFLCE